VTADLRGWPPGLTERLDAVAGQTFDERADEGRLNAISAALAQLDNELREQIQAITAKQVGPLITALEADAPLAPAELELIRLWVIGDADYYVKMENNLPVWTAELKRLLNALQQMRTENPSPPLMARMEATVRDALRMAGDITFFREQEERVRQFEAAIQKLGREDKRALAQLLAHKMRSPEL
jgi:hypothetical protein